jgi:DNA-binding transcriptional MerR regulator
MSNTVRKLTTGMLCARYNVCARTITRWVEDGILPVPDVIRGRRYFDELQVEERERQRMSKTAA